MKIGKFVQAHISQIFDHCQTTDPEELAWLQDLRYSKETFGINYPFCTRIEEISLVDSVRYWTRKHQVGPVQVRVTSQWFNPPTSNSRQLFESYLRKLRIEPTSPSAPANPTTTAPERRPARGRYRSHAIGNAQNAFVRYIFYERLVWPVSQLLDL